MSQVQPIPARIATTLAALMFCAFALTPWTAHAQPASAKGTRSDAAIAQDLDALLAEATWATVTSVSAAIEHEVNNGVIQLSGVVGSELEREALLVAARGIPGVKSVEDADLAVVPRDITAI